MTGSAHPEGVGPRAARLKGWLVDLAIGGIGGFLVGAVVAVNFVILTGVERGYESSLGEVFEHSLIAGIVTVVILVAGPIAGVYATRHRRARSR